jgi:SNF2 family DNA or RNA helicase
MTIWNKENIVEINHSDKHGVKNKIRNLFFDDSDDLKNLLTAYGIINSQHTRGLTIQNSLKSTIQILDHQIMAAKIVKNDLNGRVILADEVGLGKTIEAGILLKEYFVTGMIKNALILTPPSLRTQWKEELKTKFDLDFISNNDDDRFEDFDKHSMLIASLSAASTGLNSEKLNSIDWDIVIVDEAHRLKNASAKAHQFVKELPKKFIFLLSATPIQNNIQELYNMVEIIRPGILGSWNNFAASYTTDKKARVINPSKRGELQQLLRQAVVRTTREEVKNYIQFTDRIPKTHLLDPTLEESELYNKATDFVRDLWLKERGGRHFILPLMTLQRQISSSSAAVRTALFKKINQYPDSKDELNDIVILSDKIKKDTKMIKLEEIIKQNPDAKHLIFTEFTDTQDYIFDTLEDSKIQAVKFNGSMSTGDRDTAVSKFKRDVQVLVSTEAGGEGQNFQFCSNVINYDLPWNPMKIEQRVGRVHRIGQTEDVKIHNLAIVGSIEEYVLKLLFDKINLFKMTIGDLDLLFEDEGFDKMPAEIFESFMSSKNRGDIENKFSALGNKWAHEKEKINDTIMEFDNEVFSNFDLSALSD